MKNKVIHKKIKKPAENPFEKFANARKKHEVVNRRVKGEDRNVGRARSKAVDDRKKTLLADFISSKKSNTFSDKRFGEHDATMSLEDKLFQRFQHEKMKKAKKASKFSLDSSSATILTHRGKALGETTYNDQDWNESSDDENLASEAVSRLHFGGGLVETGKSTSDSDGFSYKKTHGDILQEIVMKSKLFKLEKKEAKDAQEEQLELVDKAYDELVGSALLDFKPMKRDRSEMRDSSLGAGDQYDSLLRSLAFESKVQASNKTESAEVIAKAERKKQEILEGERVKRMKMDHLVLAPALSLPGKFTSHQLNDDCIYELYEDYNAQNTSRRQDSATEGMVAEYSDNESMSDESDGVESLEEEEEEEDGDDDDDASENNNDEDGEEKDEQEKEEEDNVSGKQSNQSDSTILTSRIKEIPPTLDYPTNLSEFENMCKEYREEGGSLVILLNKIVATASKEDAAKIKFLKILLSYVIKTGDTLSTAKQELQAITMLSQIDSVLSAVYRMTCNAPTLYVRTFQKMILKIDDDLTKRLKAFAAGRTPSCWPSLGHIIFFQQLVTVFASSDFKHGIIGPALMLLCRCISQCPVNSPHDLACGTLLCCVVLNYTELTKEVIPEVAIFCSHVFDSLSADQIVSTEWLQSVVKMSASTFAEKANRLSWSIFGIGSKSSGSENIDAAIFSLNFFLKMVRSLKHRYSESRDAALFVDTMNMVTVFFANHASWRQFLDQCGIDGVTESGSVETKIWPPLQWRRALKKDSISIAPAFDLHYTMKKASSNSDADVEKLKALKRQMKREKKASMRELRKDSAFLATEAYREKTQHKAALRDERAKNFAWLQDEQAVFNQQVRMGRVEMRGGGSNGIKTAIKKRTSRK